MDEIVVYSNTNRILLIVVLVLLIIFILLVIAYVFVPVATAKSSIDSINDKSKEAFSVVETTAADIESTLIVLNTTAAKTDLLENTLESLIGAYCQTVLLQNTDFCKSFN